MKITITSLTMLALGLFCADAEAKIQRFIKVDDGFYRGSQPENEADYEQLKKLGVRTLVNLRTSDDNIEREARLAARFGLKLVSVPLSAITPPSDRDINQVLADVRDPSLKPVFLHCRHGKDRTGLIVGLYRVLFEGWGRRKAHEEMKAVGFSSWLLGLEKYFWSRTKDYPTLAAQ